MTDVPRIQPRDLAEWAGWLATNHDRERAVWLIFRKKGAPGGRSIEQADAVEEALCWGWIDSKVRPIDEHRYEQYFSRRKPTSIWSEINKARIERLESAGRMQPAGRRVVAVAKENGMWSLLDDAMALVVPEVLAEAFSRHPGSAGGFDTLRVSERQRLLAWIAMAKRPETKAKRAEAIAEAAVDARLPGALS
jgi:uncharacterized protein YdeI (YjbR/CyaY-like superfamily)